MLAVRWFDPSYTGAIPVLCSLDMLSVLKNTSPPKHTPSCIFASASVLLALFSGLWGLAIYLGSGSDVEAWWLAGFGVFLATSLLAGTGAFSFIQALNSDGFGP
ncbi:MAG: hypothetical protein R3C68_16350 [Myxococcota bacterium]